MENVVKIVCKVLYILTLLLLINSINSVSAQVNNDKIIGKWVFDTNYHYLRQVNYAVLYFKTDSTATFIGRDTIYRYKYYLLRNILDILVLQESKTKESSWRIYRLDSNRLVFESLLEHKIPQYYRKAPNDVNCK